MTVFCVRKHTDREWHPSNYKLNLAPLPVCSLTQGLVDIINQFVTSLTEEIIKIIPIEEEEGHPPLLEDEENKFEIIKF